MGLAIGIPVALMAARWMTDQLYEVRSYDPLSLVMAVVVLLLSATVAGFVPARRAANIEPMRRCGRSDGVLPDGPTARGAATSWRVYLSGR